MGIIGNSWDDILKETFESDVSLKLKSFLENEYKTQTIYPKSKDVLTFLKLTPYENVKVCIIGQDPYYNPEQAHGLAFSVNPTVPTPRSLKNIFKEIESDVGIKNEYPYLTKWATQGVLLMNAVLTVRAKQPNSHKGKGWEYITTEIIKKLNQREKPIVFLLWGGNARAKKDLITNPNHLILESAHPSPLSAYHGFFGCKHFSKTNKFLIDNNMDPIDWSTK